MKDLMEIRKNFTCKNNSKAFKERNLLFPLQPRGVAAKFFIGKKARHLSLWSLRQRFESARGYLLQVLSPKLKSWAINCPKSNHKKIVIPTRFGPYFVPKIYKQEAISRSLKMEQKLDPHLFEGMYKSIILINRKI